MLSFQIAGLIADVTEGINDDNYFVAAVKILAEPLGAIAEDLKAIGTNTNNGSYANSILNKLNAFHERKSLISPRKFYAALETIHISLNNFQNKVASSSEYVQSLIADIDSFAGMFDAYLSNPTAPNAAPLALAAPRVVQRIRDFKESLSLFDDLIEELPMENDNNSVLSIVLSGSFGFKEFLARLEAIESIYSELCQLLNISEIDYPLEIAKIESGSLLAKVAGSAVVIGLMTQFIQSTATYAYENYTIEGRIKAIPTKVESLDKVIELTKKLKDAGVDTSGMEENLAKSGYTIAKDLNTLIEGQPSIVVNGFELSGITKNSIKQISSKNVPKLAGK